MACTEDSAAVTVEVEDRLAAKPRRGGFAYSSSRTTRDLGIDLSEVINDLPFVVAQKIDRRVMIDENCLSQSHMRP